MNKELKLGVVQTALKKMYRVDGHFSICTIREICQLCGVFLPKETEAAMHLLHCVKFADMEPNARKWIAATIDELFKDPDNLVENSMPQIARSQRVALSGNAFLQLEGGEG